MIDASIGDGVGATRRFVDALPTLFPSLAEHLGEDSAVIDWPSEQLVVTADSFVVDPIMFPGGDLGHLAVCGIVNDLACRGATPVSLMLNVLLGRNAEETSVQSVLASAARTCAAVGIDLVGGDTKHVDVPGIDIVLSAFGVGRPQRWPAPLTLRAARPGDRLICTGNLADHAIAILSEREGLGFERVVESDCQPLSSTVEALRRTVPDGIVAIRDLTRGGLGGALLDLARMSGHHVAMRRGDVPVAPMVDAACDMLALDPLFLVNEGRLLVVARAGHAAAVLAALRRLEAGRDAVEVGEVEEPTAGGEATVRLADAGAGAVLAEPNGMPAPRLC